MNLVYNIAVGAVASLVATLVWVLVGNVYRVNIRLKNAALLRDAENTSRSVYHNFEFDKYDLGMMGVFKLHDLLNQLQTSLFWGNYPRPAERKLFFTYIYHIKRILDISKNLSVGGRNAREEDEYRCKKLLKRYFIYTNNTGEEYQTIEVLLHLLYRLNNNEGYTRALTFSSVAPDMTKKDLCELIDVNSFKSNEHDGDEQRKRCFTQEEYKKFLDKYFIQN
ncbi:hypothetical protein [Candidatus Avelusimicrobium fimicolum]|uniref:hypothetical protein n=1 Tax=Candidatus Avelusimicrobium fimicolum TaxID=3416216 RepID=UPI003D09ED26